MQRLAHGLRLLVAHREALVVRAAQGAAAAQLGQRGLHVRQRAAHPFELRPLTAPTLKGGAQFVVSDHAAIGTLGGFIHFDAEIGDCRRAQLLGHALAHVARGLTDFQQAGVGIVGNGVGVQAGAGCGLRGQEDVDRRSIHQHLHRPKPHRINWHSNPSDARFFR
nr:hypothetical protein [Melaminivora alkalimesophila]